MGLPIRFSFSDRCRYMVFILQSGIHSTISGVILAFVIPAKPRLDVGNISSIFVIQLQVSRWWNREVSC